MSEKMKGIYIGSIFIILCIVGGTLAIKLPPILKVEYQPEFAQEVTLSELLSLQNDLADEKIFIFFRFMVLDTTVIPEAILLVQGLNSKQMDIIAQKQAEYQGILFGLRLRL